jgi:uncharacterized glyoxalase superfamily protein PhnB
VSGAVRSFTAELDGDDRGIAMQAFELDRLHAELTAAGYRSDGDPFDAFWGQRYATVLDPDGNPVDLFASLSQEA